MRRFLDIFLLLAVMMAATGCRKSTPGKRAHYPDPAKYAVRGIDISAHNGVIDFNKVAADGISFVVIKATEGGTFKDKRFVENVRKAREAGLKVGAYHFFRFDTPGYMQGLNFLNSIRGRKMDLPLVIDLEEWANPNSQPTPIVLSRLYEMIDHLESHGHTVMIYTNKNGYARFVKGRLESYPLWICSLVDEPDDEVDWVFWQATHSGRVNGIEHPVDINAFNGNHPDWQEFLLPEPDDPDLDF